MKYLLILGCTIALAVSTSTLANSIDRGARTLQTTKILHANNPLIKDSNFQKELYRLCRLAQTGNGETIYYSNGQVMTHWAGRENSTWYYSNGQVMTHWAGSKNSTWYYSNGQVMTHWAGSKNSTWYYSNGQVMTHWAGRENSTWYHPNGEIMTYSGNFISDQELLYPCSYIK